MKLHLLISLLVILLMTKNGVFIAADGIFKSLLSENKCFPESLLPLLNMTWDSNKVEVNQLLEPIAGNCKTKFFFQARGLNPNLRSNGVACMSAPNLSSVSFSYDGIFLNQPVEFHFDHTLGNTKVSLTELTNGGKKSFLFTRMTNELDFEAKKFAGWKLAVEYLDKKPFIEGKFHTDCNLFEPYSDSPCSFKILLNIPEFKLFWTADGIIQRSSNGDRFLSVRFHRGNSSVSPFLLEANWNHSLQNNFMLSAEISSGNRSFLLCKINTTSVNSSQDFKIEIISHVFDWQLFSNWTIQNNSGRKITSVTEGNYFFQPSAVPIKYLFGFLENMSALQVVDLRHNISSALYHFEGNMTVELEPMPDSEPAVITQIYQIIRTSLEKPVHLDLQQIFHKCGEWSWETVVLKSGWLNMHVNGLWNHSIFDLYKKQFQFHSHDEDNFPSLNFALNYSDRLRFHHHATFPFLARSYDIMIEFTNPSSFFPMNFNILFRDEFKTNFSRSVFLFNVHKNFGVLNAHASGEWLDLKIVMEGIKNQLTRLFSWVEDDQHAINKILEPILRRPTVGQCFRDLLVIFPVD